MKDFKKILENIGKDVLADDHKVAIAEAFEAAVNEKVDSRVKLEVEEAVKHIDEDHAARLEKLLEAIDVDHTNKFKKVLVKVDEDYAEKLKTVVEKYEKILKVEAIKFREQLVTEMTNFIDLYIDQMIPVEQLQEAVDNTKAKRTVEAMRKLVAVDEEYINENIRQALEDGKEQIDNLREELHEAMKANIRLNQEYKRTSADKMLIEKTVHFDEPKKNYVMRVLNGKSPEEVEQNFDYVVEMFERKESEQYELIKESAKTDGRSVKSTKIDIPKSEHKEDVFEESAPIDSVDSYLNEMTQLFK